MVKRIALCLLVTLLVAACDKFPVGAGAGAVATALTLHTTAGAEARVFRSGEEFEMRFSLSNSMRSPLCAQYTPPELVFRIHAGDSLVASSVDGMAFPQVLLTVCVEAGQGISLRWNAPNAPGRSPAISLPPGEYTASVHHALYALAVVPRALPVAFTVAP
jgi:hypothetical protein